MESIYAALLLHKAGSKINESNTVMAVAPEMMFYATESWNQSHYAWFIPTVSGFLNKTLNPDIVVFNPNSHYEGGVFVNNKDGILERLNKDYSLVKEINNNEVYIKNDIFD